MTSSCGKQPASELQTTNDQYFTIQIICLTGLIQVYTGLTSDKASISNHPHDKLGSDRPINHDSFHIKLSVKDVSESYTNNMGCIQLSITMAASIMISEKLNSPSAEIKHKNIVTLLVKSWQTMDCLYCRVNKMEIWTNFGWERYDANTLSSKQNWRHFENHVFRHLSLKDTSHCFKRAWYKMCVSILKDVMVGFYCICINN